MKISERLKNMEKSAYHRNTSEIVQKALDRNPERFTPSYTSTYTKYKETDYQNGDSVKKTDDGYRFGGYFADEAVNKTMDIIRNDKKTKAQNSQISKKRGIANNPIYKPQASYMDAFKIGNANNTALGKYTPKAKTKKDSVGAWVGKNVLAGLNQFNKGVAATIDYILPTEILGKYDFASKINDYYTKNLNYYSNEALKSSKSRGKGYKTGGEILQGTVAAVPNAILAFMTAGGSVATEGANAISQGTSALGSSNLAGTIKTVSKQMLKNPQFWTSFLQTAGTDYEEAKANGANDIVATVAAMGTSLINAGIEIGGGIEELPKNIKKGGKNTLNNFIEWGSSMIDEGKEEVVQGLITQSVAKLLYDPNMKTFSLKDDNALINPKKSAKEFAMGATVGGILGGAQMGTIKAINKISDISTQKNIANSKTATFTPKNASNEIKNLENGLISNGVNDVFRKEIINGALEIENVLKGSDRSIKNVFNEVANITKNVTQKIQSSAGESTGYWNIFGANVKAISSGEVTGNAELIREYSNAYTQSLKKGNPQRYAAATLDADGMDMSSTVVESVITGEIPASLQGNSEYASVVRDIQNIVNEASGGVLRERKNIYGENIKKEATAVDNEKISDIINNVGGRENERGEGEADRANFGRVEARENSAGTDNRIFTDGGRSGENFSKIGQTGENTERSSTFVGRIGESLGVQRTEQKNFNTQSEAWEAYNGNAVGDGISEQQNEQVVEYENDTPESKQNNVPLTFNEEKALMQYKSTESYFMNWALRNGETLTAEQKTRMDNLNSALNKLPIYEGTVYRNISFFTRKKFESFIEEHRNRKTVNYEAFTSASKETQGYIVDSEFTAHYEIESHSGRDVENYGRSDEKEVLFKTDTEFAITEFNVSENEIYIKAEERYNYGKELQSSDKEGRNKQRAESDGRQAEYFGQANEDNRRENTVRGRSEADDGIPSEQSEADGRTAALEDVRHNSEVRRGAGNRTGTENGYISRLGKVSQTEKYNSVVNKDKAAILASGFKPCQINTGTGISGVEIKREDAGYAKFYYSEDSGGRKLYPSGDIKIKQLGALYLPYFEIRGEGEYVKVISPCELSKNGMADCCDVMKKGVIELSHTMPNTRVETADEIKYPHLYDEEKVSKEYLDSVNTEIENAVISIRNGDVDSVPDVIDVTEMNANTIKAISELVGFDVSGYTCRIERDRLAHIEKRHGINGKHDHSLSDPKDIARMGYVINNSDSIDRLVDSKGAKVYDAKYNDRNNHKVPVLIMEKRIDGTYTISQVVLDSKKKTLWITSARIEKAAVGSQVPNDSNAIPQPTSKTPLVSSSASDNSIAQNNDIVNSDETKSDDLHTKKLHRVYEPRRTEGQNSNRRRNERQENRGYNNATVERKREKVKRIETEYDEISKKDFSDETKEVFEKITSKGKTSFKKANELFKKLTNSIPLLENDAVVYATTGNEFENGEKKLSQQVYEYFESLGGIVHRENFGDVAINDKGVDSSIAHGMGRAKAIAFASVPAVIEKGRQIDFVENWKGRNYDSYVFAAPIQIGKQRAFVGVVVTKSAKDNRYYLHEVSDNEGNIIIIKKDDASFKSKSEATNDSSSLGETSSTDIISKNNDIVNSDETKSDDLHTEKLHRVYEPRRTEGQDSNRRRNGRQENRGYNNDTVERKREKVKNIEIEYDEVSNNDFSDETKEVFEKITVDMDDEARADLLNKKSVNVVSVDAENTKALDNVDLDALQNSYPSYARPIIKKIARDFGILNEPFFNPDIELEFSYSGDSVQESINKQHSRYGDFVKMLSVFSDVIENAVGVETHKDKYTGTRREDTNLKQMYVLASAFRDEKGVYPVKLEVKEFKKNTNKLYLSVVLTKKESRYLSGNLGQDQLNTAPPTSTVSISDLVGIVNPSEGDFLKYFPDSMLDSKQIGGKNKALAKDAEKIEKLSENKKRSLDAAGNAKALSSTSKTTGSTASDNIISKNNDIVNNDETKKEKILSVVKATLKPEITSNSALMDMLTDKFGFGGLNALADEIEVYHNKNKALDDFEYLFKDSGKELYKALTSPMEEKVKYSVSTFEKDIAISDDDVKSVQSIPRKSVGQFTADDIKKTESFARQYYKEMGVKSPFFIAWFGDWRANDNTQVKLANEKGNARGVIKNKDTGWDIRISGKVFNETKAHNHYQNIGAKPFLEYINSIAENAVLLDTYTIPNEKAKSENYALMHSLYAIADMGNGIELLKLYVEELNDVNKDGTIKRAYQLQNIASQQLNAKGSDNVPARSSSTADNVSPESNRFSYNSPASSDRRNIHRVSQLFEIVKRVDKNFKPNVSSKVVNKDGSPKAVYRGTNEKFNYELSGFYFSESAEESGSYGENTGAYYINIKNPYTGDIYALQKEKGSFKKAYDYLVSQGYDGVIIDKLGEEHCEYIVFSSENIKSATDNIGTFDRESKDIRYSSAYENIFKASKKTTEKLSNQIDSWLKGKMKYDEHFQIGETPEVLKALGEKELPVVMSQDVMAKITGIKHDISLDEIRALPNAIADPIMIFNSATVSNAYVILTELTDKNGNDVVVAMHLNKKSDRLSVNRVTSVYGKENIENFIEVQVENGNLKYIDKIKSQQWSTSRGLRLPKPVQSIADNDSITQKNDIINGYYMKNSKNNSGILNKREVYANEDGRSGLLYGNAGRELNESAGEQDERISSYKQKIQGKTATEREITAKKLFEQGLTEEIIDGNHKYTLIKEAGYNEDMRNVITEARAYGKEVGFFIGEAIRKFDGQREFKIDGIRLTDNKILIRYDGEYSPQAIFMHELVHTEWDNPKMQNVKDTILSDLSERNKKEILQNGRYKDYMELYNGDEDAVWEEFIADIFADMNEFSENYIDTAVDYWYNDDITDRYSPSEYIKAMDAGGNEYSLSDVLPRLSKREYALISKAIMAENAGKANYELNPIDYIYATDEFYVYENHSIGEFSVIGKLDTETEAEIKNTLRELIDDGIRGNTDRERLNRLIDNVRRGKGSHFRSNGNIENGRYAMADDRISGDEQRSDAIGYSSGIGEDNKRKYALNIDDENFIESQAENEFDIPYNEKRQLDNYILRKNLSDNKLKKIDCKEIGDNFYVWENDSKTDYTVMNMIEIEGNEELIYDLREEMKNGTYGFTKKFGSASEGRGRNGRRSNSMLNAVYQRRKSANGNGGISSGKSAGNKGRRPKESSGNKQTKYSLSIEGKDADFWNKWVDLAKEHGVIPKGEKAVRDIDVPTKTSKTRFVSRYARTMLEAGVTPNEIIGEFEKAVIDGTMTHEVITNTEAMSYAENIIKKLGFSGALEEWEKYVHTGAVGKNQIVLGQTLYNQCVSAGDYKSAMKIAADLVLNETQAGQSLQASRCLKLMGPDGQLYYIEKSVAKMNKEFKEQIGEKYEDIKIDEVLTKKFFEAQTEEARNKAYDELLNDIARQIPLTFSDKWNSWRYLSMLGNARTHVRNTVGNTVMWAAVKIKNGIAIPIERAFIKESERTKAIKKTKIAKEFAKQDFLNIKSVLQGKEGKYTTIGDIEDRRKIFKSKLLEFLRKGNLNALEAEDLFFLKKHYTNALAGIITARKIDVDFLNDNSFEANRMLDKLRRYAIKEAQEATFRDFNSVANLISETQKNFKRKKHADTNKPSLAGKVGSFLIEGTMPFKSTPMNIAKLSGQYSPAGLIDTAVNTARDVKSGNYTATHLINEISKNLTGTAIVGLGYLLASLGFVSGGDEDDSKKNKFDKMVGEQNYALKFGDSSYEISWAAPICIPFFIGAELFNILDRKKAPSVSVISDALLKITDPFLEMSVWSGVENMLETIKYDESTALVKVPVEMVISYFSQAFPTMGGQVARIADKTKRNYYYADKNSAVPQFIQSFIGKAAGKIPFVSYMFEPKIDSWGREETYGSITERFFENTISPGYYSKVEYTAVDEELKSIYDETGESGVFPTSPKKYIEEKTVENGDERKIRYDLTAKQYTKLAKEVGQKRFEALQELIDSREYRASDIEDKVKKIKNAYSDVYSEIRKKTLEEIKKEKRE